MTTKKRKQYLTLHAVRELARGMREQQGLSPRADMLLSQINCRTTAMLDALGEITTADSRVFRAAADSLIAAWSDDGDRHTPAEFVAIGLTLVADQYAAIPAKAVRARQDFSDLEGLLALLYEQFDEGMTDMVASKRGEAVAVEYRSLVAA